MGGTPGTNEAAGQAIGYRAMFNAMDGASGTALGGSALENLVGQYTIGIGGESGRYASGSYNTFLGYSAGRGGTTSAPFSSGTYNTAIGYQALYSHTDGANKNTTVGRRAGYGITTGDYNVLLGNDAGFGITTGGSNVVIGHQAMDASSTAADGMVAIGVEALGTFNGGNVDSSVAVGEYSLNSLTDGVSSVAVGTKALRYTTGNRNTAVGSDAAYNMTTGDDNVAVGYLALGIAGAASDNTAVGNKAGRLAVKTQFGTFLGMQAGEYATGSYNTFVGGKAGQGGTTSAPYSSGQYNTAVGYNTLLNFTTGNYNVAMGYNAGDAITTGINNTCIGAFAGSSLTTKSYNTLVGQGAGSALSGGDGNNNILGYGAGGLQTSGYMNVAIGSLAWYGAGGTNNSNYGVYVGNSAGQDVTTGDYNVMIGHKAGKDSNPDNCIFIGNYASASVEGTSHEIIIGSGTDYATGFHGGGTETIRIGRASDFITNDFGENATWTHSSDRRIKKDIKDTNLGLEFILKLQPKEFKKKAPSEYPPEFEQYDASVTERKNPDRIHYGFVAQEVKEAMDDVGHSEFPVWKENRDGMQELGESELITPLVKAVQELSSENKELKDELNELKIFIKKKLGDE